jgi:hypothetical protein
MHTGKEEVLSDDSVEEEGSSSEPSPVPLVSIFLPWPLPHLFSFFFPVPRSRLLCIRLCPSSVRCNHHHLHFPEKG